MTLRKRAKWIVLLSGLGLLVLVFALKMFFGYEMAQALAHRPPYSVSVNAGRVLTVHWRRRFHAVANIEAIHGVELSPQVTGWVTRIYFHSGQHVHAGQPLVQLDPSNEEAILAHDRAAEVLDRLNLARARRLYRIKATSLANLQAAQASYEAARAQVANDRATLDKLRVSAPFSGWVGIREVNLGEYLGPSSTITTLQAWNPLRLIFTLPQQDFPLLHPGESVRVHVNAFPRRTFLGRIVALSSRINPTTRNITVDALLPNPAHVLRPGMFATVRMSVGQPRTWTAVPTSAVTYSTFGDYVYLIVAKKIPQGILHIAVAHPIVTGPSRNGLTAVRHGLEPGETIVTAGQIKLHSGVPVTVVPPDKSTGATKPASPQHSS
jgi:membrane fusion protein (multidrug efflux system)